MQEEVVLIESDIELLSNIGIPVLAEECNYWFLRTQGGEYFDDFYFDGFVSIEWDLINDLELIRDGDRFEVLKENISELYPDCKHPGAAAGTLQKFVRQMKKGDIVIIPNKDSVLLAFGEILSEQVYIYSPEDDDLDTENDEEQQIQLILTKRRDVKWTHTIKRKDLDPYLYRIIYSHNAIVDANPYEIYIDRLLHPFYIKGSKAYLTYKVNKKENIPYANILKFLNTYNNLSEYLSSKYPELELDINEIILKINVQSKGPIQFKGAMKSIIVIGLSSAILFGGNIKVLGVEFSAEGIVPGILKTVSEIKTLVDEKNDDELLRLQEELQQEKEMLQIEMPNHTNSETVRYV